MMRVSQAVIADRHAETTGDEMGDAHAPAAKRLPYRLVSNPVRCKNLVATRGVERLLGHTRENRTGNA